MGKLDIFMNTFLDYNDVFADIINTMIFHGNQVISADDLIAVTKYGSNSIPSQLPGKHTKFVMMNSPLPLCSCPMEVVSIGDCATSASFTSWNVRHRPMMPRLYSA